MHVTLVLSKPVSSSISKNVGGKGNATFFFICFFIYPGQGILPAAVNFLVKYALKEQIILCSSPVWTRRLPGSPGEYSGISSTSRDAINPTASHVDRRHVQGLSPIYFCNWDVVISCFPWWLTFCFISNVSTFSNDMVTYKNRCVHASSHPPFSIITTIFFKTR